MSERKSIEIFLSEIDEDVVKYASEFRKHGFTSNNSMKNWEESDFHLINVPVPEGHKRMIMKAVSRMLTAAPKVKRKNTPTVGESPETKSHCTESKITGDLCSPRRRKTGIVSRRRLGEMKNFNLLEPHGSESEDEICDEFEQPVSNVRHKTEKSVISPIERYIKSKEAEVRTTSIEIEEKRRELEHTIKQIESASSLMGRTGQRCSHCHQRNHTVRSCRESKCESSLLCGLLSKHPDEKRQFDEKKRAIASKEASLKRLQQELVSRQNSFYRVNNSVNMNIEDMLIQEYPEDYVVDGTRNWLKIQKDVALVKKHIRSSNDITRSKIRSILSATTSTDLSLPPRIDSVFADDPKTPIQCKLESYGVSFPTRSMTKKCQPALAFYQLGPNSEDEEIEQLRMATKLSLVTENSNVSEKDIAIDGFNTNAGEMVCGITTDTVTSVEKTSGSQNMKEEAANILLGLSRGRDSNVEK